MGMVAEPAYLLDGWDCLDIGFVLEQPLYPAMVVAKPELRVFDDFPLDK
jgi:hypothetical protein